MKLLFIAVLAQIAGFLSYGQQATPRMLSVDPPSGKKGDVIAVTGENLQKEQVAKVFLTDGKNDTPVVVTEQTTTTIKFKIPDKINTGRLIVMILTAGSDAKYMEQPVRVTIEE